MLDILVLAFVIFLFQLPVFYLVSLRDAEIKRLNSALLRAERPEVSAIVATPEHKEKTPEETARDKDLVKERQAMWQR